VHGGPGAPGSVAAVARELSKSCGVLEPIQTATTVAGQVAELNSTIEQHAGQPVVLVGHSWGAWLAYMTAARHPQSVSRLILVASAAFEQRYVADLVQTRMERLDAQERLEFSGLVKLFRDNDAPGSDQNLRRLGALASKADDYEVVVAPEDDADVINVDGNQYQSVWTEAEALRRSGELLEMAREITCPVLAIHGGYDPSPALGVKEPLGTVIRNFRFVLLDKCGHSPWKEKHARSEFYSLLCDEIEKDFSEQARRSPYR